MTTLQHSLITLFSMNGDVENFEKVLPYTLLPDAIRRYSKLRQYSHFEESEDKTDISWIKYPKNIKTLSQQEINETPKHIVEGLRPAVIGEQTHIEKFESTNRHLPIDYFYNVKKHLEQDYIFDEFLRERIDVSGKYQDEFNFNGEKLNGKQIREVISNIENQGLYILSYMMYKSYGITTNQEWFDEHIKSTLDKAYPQELSENTYKYMKIPEDINLKITNHDWSGLGDGYISINDYKNMYENVAKNMVKIDFERIEQISRENRENQQCI